ncbi:unnamed protein product [Prorocentrum cordatum]|uniref:HEAT repeat-containing protein 1 n=1 Tax=Prorocentrum cordatum TaxID=2364126 RepID=A0ABN9WYG4_9DINO|nr:unnamed protein product [Polarella glacialis]
MPKAVPALCEAAAGARSEIRDAARQVLELIGEAIGHRDVRPQVPALIAALCDPSEGLVTRALDGLLGAVYTTPLDGSCCALVCPVVARALARGDGELRKKGLNFVRTLAQFAEGGSDELGPYIESFQAQLSVLIADPTPAVRDAAATAVGVLASLQGEGGEDGEAGWSGSLLARLRGAAVEGAELEGAAQGLAEAMAAAAPERLEALMDELVASGPQLGPLTALAYLPRAMAGAPGGAGAVARALGPMGDALAEDAEATREAGRQGLLAAVEAAADEARAAAVAGRLEEVLRMGDARARAIGAEVACELLPRRQCAGEARGSLVAAIVLGQADASAPARKAAEKAWRAATDSAQGTPGKQLKDLRPRLLQRLAADACGVEAVAAAHAGRAAALLHARLEAGGAGGVFDDLGPRIQEALESGDPATQRSACSALAEALRASGAGGGHKALRAQGLVDAARGALCSDDECVRAAAAGCFAAGPAASFAEPLLASLCAAEAAPSAAELSALRQLLAVDASGAALAALVARAGAAPHGAAQLACLAAASSAPGKLVQQAAPQAVAACIAVARAAVGQEEAAAAAAAEIAGRLDAAGVAEAAAAAVANIERGQSDAGSEAAAHVLRGILEGGPAGDVDAEDTLDALLASALLARGGRAASFARALQALAKARGAPALSEAAPARVLAALGASGAGAGDHVAPESFEALAPLLQQGVLAAAGATQRALAAQALAALARRTEEQTLAAHAVKCAGPLVRGLGEKEVAREAQAAVDAAAADADEEVRRAGQRAAGALSGHG